MAREIKIEKHGGSFFVLIGDTVFKAFNTKEKAAKFSKKLAEQSDAIYKESN